MNEKLEIILKKILSFLSKFFSPLIGRIALSKEKQFALEINDEGLTICKYLHGSRTITNLHHYNFNLIGDNTSLFNDESQTFYTQKIIEILKEQKLLEKEATIILPTSETIIKSVNIPIMDQETFETQTKDIEFWKTFDELSDIIENKILSFQALSTNEETQEQEVLVCLIEKEKIIKLNNILRLSGIKPSVYEPKCFSILNTIFTNNKDKNNEHNEFAFFEYGEKENYLITITKNKFIFAKNNISKSDIILIKQLEKMPDPSGPFWSEVFERSIQDVRGNLMDDEWKGAEEKKTIFRNLYIRTDLENSEKYLKGLQSKLPDFTIKKLSLTTSEADKDNSENILKNKQIKLKKNLDQIFLENKSLEKKLYPVIGASLRLFNPFNVKEKTFVKFKQNLYPFKNELNTNRKIQSINFALSFVLVLFLITFTSIIGLNLPTYLQKNKILASHSTIVKNYNSLMEDLKSSNSKSAKIEKEKKLAEKLTVKNDNFSNLFLETTKIVPEGVELKKIEYIKNDSVIFYEGYALTDYDLNIFIKNLKKNVGNPDITNLSLAELSQEKNIDLTPEGSQSNSDTVANVLKLRNFKIKVDL